jgi:hypothetical protein
MLIVVADDASMREPLGEDFYVERQVLAARSPRGRG